MTASIRIDPETGQKHFNTRAAKATDKIAGKGYSVIEEVSLYGFAKREEMSAAPGTGTAIPA